MEDITNIDLTYVSALTELRALVDSLANEQDIDRLATQVSRAKVLIDFCRSRIANAEMQITQIMADELDEELF